MGGKLSIHASANLRNHRKCLKNFVVGLREAVMVSVTHEQFKIRSELEVVHIPTQAVFRAYPYNHPDDVLQSVKVIWGRAGAPADSGYAEQVRRVASQLLLEQCIERLPCKKNETSNLSY